MPAKPNQKVTVNSHLLKVGKENKQKNNKTLATLKGQSKNTYPDSKWTCQTKATQIPFSNRETHN